MGDKLYAHVLGRLYKADPSRAGSGSGLAIAIENAPLLGGGIDAWSKTDAGARFTLRLPTNPSEASQTLR